jgi:hypothetical protein
MLSLKPKEERRIKMTARTLRLVVGSVVKGLRPAFLGAGLPSPGVLVSSIAAQDDDILGQKVGGLGQY